MPLTELYASDTLNIEKGGYMLGIIGVNLARAHADMAQPMTGSDIAMLIGFALMFAIHFAVFVTSEHRIVNR